MKAPFGKVLPSLSFFPFLPRQNLRQEISDWLCLNIVNGKFNKLLRGSNDKYLIKLGVLLSAFPATCILTATSHIGTVRTYDLLAAPPAPPVWLQCTFSSSDVIAKVYRMQSLLIWWGFHFNSPQDAWSVEGLSSRDEPGWAPSPASICFTSGGSASHPQLHRKSLWGRYLS